MKPKPAPIMSLVKIAVSAALLFFLYRNTPLAQIAAVLAASNALPLVLVAGILLVNTTLSAWKWRILLVRDGIDIPLAELLTSCLIAGFFNLFLPSSIGGDSYRIYDIMRKSGQAARATASVLADRLSGFVALSCLSFGASIVVAPRLGRPLLMIPPLFALIALALALFLLWRKTPALRLVRMARLDRFPKLVAFLDGFFAAFARYGNDSRTLIQVMLISFAFQFLLVLAVYLMAMAIQARAPFSHFAAFVPLITLLEALPVSVYGIGVRDMGYVFFFQGTGMDEVHSRALPILFVAVTLCYALIGGALHGRRVFFGKTPGATIDDKPGDNPETRP